MDPVVTALLEAAQIVRDFRLPKTRLFEPAAFRRAVDHVDLTLTAAQTLSVIGESGSGKSTLVRILLALDRATSGSVTFEGASVTPGATRSLLWFRRHTGVVFQDPYASLNPRLPIGRIIAEPLHALDIPGDHEKLVTEMLGRVGLTAATAQRYPHELSGGQRQRVALSRALVHRPRLLVGDEPLSALDATVRAAVLELIEELREQLGLAVLLVSHDVGLVQRFSDRVAVMQTGKIVETGVTATVLSNPQHPYTQRLLASVPTLD